MAVREKIKIDFVDFWPGFQKTDNFFYKQLARRYEVEISDTPDYLFCSCFSAKHYRYHDCVKLLYLGEDLVPDFNLYDYAMGFHYIDFEDRYLRLPHYVLYEDRVALALEKHRLDGAADPYGRKFCGSVVSNPDADPMRDRILDAMDAYRHVDCGGRYRNNVGGAVEDKIAFARQYRFMLALENTSTPGYTTEKITDAYAAGTVPIYWGNPRIAEEFHPDSFINCTDCGSVEEMVERVRTVDEDASRYLAMLRTPMLREGCEAGRCLGQGYVEDFLAHVVAQGPRGARRRSNVYTGWNYQQKQRSAQRVLDALDIVRRPIHKLHLMSAQRKK